MATKKYLSLIFISYIISICISQPPGSGNQNVYTGRIDLLPDQFNNARNFAEVTIDYNNNRVEIVYEGTDNAWNGIGFGQQVMEGSYAIIMDYDQGQEIVFETILGDHQPGDQLSNSNLNVELDLFNGSIPNQPRRRITVSRPIQAAEADIGYSFPDQPQQGSPEPVIIPIIAAQGPGYNFYVPPTNRHSFFDREPS